MNNFLTKLGCMNTKAKLLLVRSATEVPLMGRPSVANLWCNVIVFVGASITEA